MKYVQCDVCREYGWDNSHTCKPVFSACIDYSPRSAPWSRPPRDDEWSDVRASDAEEAAETFADRYDSQGDYTIIKNREGRVWVRHSEGPVTRWEIEAEAVPEYRARVAT